MSSAHQTVNSFEELAASVRKRLASLRREIPMAIHSGALAGETELRRRSKKVSGRLRDGWETHKSGDGARVMNDAPHAGVVEAGARPHGMSEEGIEALTQWALRSPRVSTGRGTKGGSANARRRARDIAFAVAKKFSQEGQEPTFFVRKSQRKLRRILKNEVEAEITKLASKKF